MTKWTCLFCIKQAEYKVSKLPPTALFVVKQQNEDTARNSKLIGVAWCSGHLQIQCWTALQHPQPGLIDRHWPQTWGTHLLPGSFSLLCMNAVWQTLEVWEISQIPVICKHCACTVARARWTKTLLREGERERVWEWEWIDAECIASNLKISLAIAPVILVVLDRPFREPISAPRRHARSKPEKRRSPEPVSTPVRPLWCNTRIVTRIVTRHHQTNFQSNERLHHKCASVSVVTMMKMPTVTSG